MNKIIVLLLVSCCMACSSEDDSGNAQTTCTEELIFGLSVTVQDAATDITITEGITVLAIDGDYEETLELASDVFIGAAERVGLYTVVVSGEGYETKEIESINVLLTEDECHVIPQEVTVALLPN